MNIFFKMKDMYLNVCVFTVCVPLHVYIIGSGFTPLGFTECINRAQR